MVLILPMSFCVQQELKQPKDLRQNKSVLIILPTQGKTHIVQVCTIYFYIPNPNHKTYR